MVLIGEYTQLPDWIPVQAGSGILALERGADGVYREAGVCPTENPSYLVPATETVSSRYRRAARADLPDAKKRRMAQLRWTNPSASPAAGAAISALTAGQMRPMWQTMSPAR